MLQQHVIRDINNVMGKGLKNNMNVVRVQHVNFKTINIRNVNKLFAM